MGPKTIEKPLVEKLKEKKKRKSNALTNISIKENDVPKLKILCLHGFRTSGKIMAEQISLASWNQLLNEFGELVFLDAPWPASGRSDVEKRFEGPYFEWYQANEDFTEVYGLDDAISYISDYTFTNGPFDGIIGFSQGAILAAALVGLFEKGIGPRLPNVFFLILASAGKSKAKPLKPAYFDPIMCLSLHMIGNNDYMKESGEALAAVFEEPLVIRHPFGHIVPMLGEFEEKLFREFLEEQLNTKLSPLKNAKDLRKASASYFEDRVALS